MFDWILEIKHRKLLRMAKRELELKQVMCLHTYEYMGKTELEHYNGIDVDWNVLHHARCTKCHKVVKEYKLNNLKVECGLEINN